MRIAILTIYLLSAFLTSAHAGVSIGGTRVIFDGHKKEASLIVFSSEDDTYPYLIQSFIDNKGEKGDISNNTRPPFIITPPLFRLEPGKENSLRIIKTAETLPDDRESVFWINVKAIPGSDKNADTENTLKLVLKNRVKLFYRPSGIMKRDADTFSKVTFSRQGSAVIVSNPTPYFISFNSLRVGGKTVDTSFVMVPPKGQARYLLPDGVSGNDVSWSYITDYGNASGSLSGRM
ncbi:molecular chaperone [Salmonella enterica]